VAELLSLDEAIDELVHDGDSVALEGFTHLIPFAAGQEIIRQQRRDLTLIRMTPDLIYDQMIGAGCARKLIFSWGGNPGVGSLHRLRDAVEHDWPAPLELEEHSHAGMAARYAAGASNLPFGTLRGYVGTELLERSAETVAPIECPFTGENLTAVRALRPDVGIVHAQRADRQGNVQIWGIVGVQKEIVLASERSLVTVEEVVDELEPRAGAIVLPTWAVGAVAEAPRGAHPSYAHDYYDRNNGFYQRWDAISRDRDSFQRWIAENVLASAGVV
jgi:glutaconate CoA-transferase, subunit A